jgi:hypothetical protein
MRFGIFTCASSVDSFLVCLALVSLPDQAWQGNSGIWAGRGGVLCYVMLQVNAVDNWRAAARQPGEQSRAGQSK